MFTREVVATPAQQNGVVGKKHRHLLDSDRALLFQSNLPIQYWGECVLTATYLVNRMPLSSIHFLTPYERLYSHKPNLDHLRTFGCLCFASIPPPLRSKLDPKSDPCVFVGYPASQKGYKLLNLKNNKIFVSKDVHFHEKYFPFHFSNTPKTSYSHQFFLPVTTDLSTCSDQNFFYAELTSNTSHLTPISTSIPIPTPSPPPIRKSTCSTKPPSHLQDYVCTLSHHSPPAHWCNIVSSSYFPSTHTSLTANDMKLQEPSSYLEVSKDPLWIEAMNYFKLLKEMLHGILFLSLKVKRPLGVNGLIKLNSRQMDPLKGIKLDW